MIEWCREKWLFNQLSLSKLSIAKFSMTSLVRDWKRKLKLITLGSERDTHQQCFYTSLYHHSNYYCNNNTIVVIYHHHLFCVTTMAHWSCFLPVSRAWMLFKFVACWAPPNTSTVSGLHSGTKAECSYREVRPFHSGQVHFCEAEK